MPFDFWYTLSDECARQAKAGNTRLKEAFTPCFHRWMDSLIVLLNYPDDFDEHPADKQVRMDQDCANLGQTFCPDAPPFSKGSRFAVSWTTHRMTSRSSGTRWPTRWWTPAW
eukprot:SAG22_NODE_2136_length_2957_cov_1.888034_3_plen_112_part_00